MKSVKITIIITLLFASINVSPYLFADEFQVNQWDDYFQIQPQVAMDAMGNFVVVWTSKKYKEYEWSNYDIYARRYDNHGNPLSDEFIVNTYTADDQDSATIAMSPDGDFVCLSTRILPASMDNPNKSQGTKMAILSTEYT